MKGYSWEQSGHIPGEKREGTGCQGYAHPDRSQGTSPSVRFSIGKAEALIAMPFVLCLLVLALPQFHVTVCAAEETVPRIEGGSGKTPPHTGTSDAPAAPKKPKISDPFSEFAEATRLGTEGKLEDIPRLIERLDHKNSGTKGKSAQYSSIDKMLQHAIERILKRTISRRPTDVHVLDPLFAAATGGSLNQRKAAIEILGWLKEPLAEPLLARIAEQTGNPLKETAVTGLSRIRSKDVANRESLRMRYFQIFLLVACVLCASGLTVAAVRGLRQNGNPWRVVLLLLCLLLTVWFFGIIGSDYLMSSVTDKRIDDAIEQKSLLALAKKINFDWSDYPADSFAARQIVSKGDGAVIPLLIQIKKETVPSIRYQDYWNKHLQQRIDWIIARLEEVKKTSDGSSGVPKHEPPR